MGAGRSAHQWGAPHREGRPGAPHSTAASRTRGCGCRPPGVRAAGVRGAAPGPVRRQARPHAPPLHPLPAGRTLALHGPKMEAARPSREGFPPRRGWGAAACSAQGTEGGVGAGPHAGHTGKASCETDSDAARGATLGGRLPGSAPRGKGLGRPGPRHRRAGAVGRAGLAASGLDLLGLGLAGPGVGVWTAAAAATAGLRAALGHVREVHGAEGTTANRMASLAPRA